MEYSRSVAAAWTQWSFDNYVKPLQLHHFKTDYPFCTGLGLCNVLVKYENC